MKRFLFVLALFANVEISFSSPTILAPGDIAIISFNFENPDDFSFLTLVELAPGTVIYFTDCGWNNDGSFRVGEGLITYTVPEEKSAMSVVSYPNDNGFTTEGINGFFGFAEAGDQLLVFQGSFSFPSFIFGLNNTNTPSWQTSAIDNNSSCLPEGLTEGVNALSLSGKINNEYNCVLSKGTKEEILSSVTNPLNWMGSNAQRVSLPPSCFKDALPVTIISSILEERNGIYIISFVTMHEKNIERYLVEQSEDGVNYWPVYEVLPLNGGDERNLYQITVGIPTGKFYRLKIMESDGSFSFRLVTPSGKPASGANILSYRVYDFQGRQLLISENFNSPTVEMDRELREFPEGIYVLLVYTEVGSMYSEIRLVGDYK